VLCRLHNKTFNIDCRNLINSGATACRQCEYIKRSTWRITPFDVYIENLKQKQPELYEKYDVLSDGWTGSSGRIKYICPLHGEKITDAGSFINGHGCKDCGVIKCTKQLFKDTEYFITEAKKIHGDRYDYSTSNYTAWKKPINIICRKHGEFTLTNAGYHLQKDGKKGNCPICTKEEYKNKRSIKKDEWIYRSNTVTRKVNIKYDYSDIVYIDFGSIVKNISCPYHGYFNQMARQHMYGAGCRQCGYEQIRRARTKSVYEFVINARKKYDTKFTYNIEEYGDRNTPITILCKEHETIWTQSPYEHMYYGPKCKICSGTYKGYSRMQIDWITDISNNSSIFIQHAENKGEFEVYLDQKDKFGRSKYKLDGYCEETNTVYEFHGDYWHGNPRKYDGNDINETNGFAYGYLYNKTLEKENVIKKMGYKLVVMWEMDWKKIQKTKKRKRKT
jgi:rubrerythrin/ribosomal protein L40E